ncbi:CPBP family intramembrane metalloprotease [Thiothrix subterranea]|uniref:CPBP family intramembrane glutamic endopeptidase n=1 Tax=Thiothrix subterranea TaxID=2735563 RepID=UPI00192C04C7|nr:CPBP family intramembrane glutamic endopeptidase [Thiothrix subterranea]QQZ27526.1 CPBP family intramembrane metalloprotease [Thiothrix subterranea]
MSYVDLAKQGKNAWWRYVLGLVIIAVMTLGFGMLPFFFLIRMVESDQNEATTYNFDTMEFEGVNFIIEFLVETFVFIGMLGGIYLVVRFIQKRNFITLITSVQNVSWKRIFQGFGLYFVLMMLWAVINMVFAIDEFRLTFQPEKLFLFMPFALLGIPIAAATEELFFRGYVMQGIGQLLRGNAWVAVLVSSLLFMFAHFENPEMNADPILSPLTYFLAGLFPALLVIKDESLELAIGIHSANNLFFGLFANYDNSVVKTPSLFTTSTPDPLIGMISEVAIFILDIIPKSQLIDG